ncbi:sensor histidine kinase [Microbaculum marinum]|uniref:Blue-light-activated histidine kinase n=1 Tax=Microbaculum marinum TaxID=1764581 RepID=A0AAW9RP34_9HYPH
MDRILQYLSGQANFATLHVISDAGIAAAYFAISIGILVFASRRRDLVGEARHLAILFSAFIALCGLTHLAAVIAPWHPYEGLEVLLNALAAIVSVVTALFAWRLMPRLVAMPSAGHVEQINQRLIEEAAAREHAYSELDEARRNLERQVAERTRELAEVRQLFEAATRGARITVYSQDRDLRYTWIHNPWLGLAEEEIVGRSDDEIMPEPARSSIAEHKRRVIETGQSETFEVEIPDGDVAAWFRVDATPLIDADGRVDGIACTAIEITRSKRLEAMRTDLSGRLSESVQRFNVALRSSDIFVFAQDTDLRYTWSNTSETQMGPVVGKTDEELLSEPDLSRVVELKKDAMLAKEPRSGEIRIDSGDEVRWYDLFIEPNISSEGEVTGITCAAVDITESKRNEDQMRLVMRELTHRSKNLLAVVQAIARQTAQQADTVPEFVNGFGERLRALAGAQDLLVAENWVGARLDHLIRGQIGHYMPKDKSRVVVEGPEITLTPEATQVLALALHELATNAAKYGALSNDSGVVTVKWSVTGDKDSRNLRLTWEEEGGPAVQPPTHRGFGRIVVEQNVARSLDADVDLTFPPDGVKLRFVIPLEQLNPSARA